MQSPTITMEKEAALKKLDEYEQAAKKNPKRVGDTDRQIMQGYRVLARGGRLVDVMEAIRAAGLNLAGQPKLAIARADADRSRWERRGMSTRSTYDWLPVGVGSWNGRYRGNRWRWEMPEGSFDQAKMSEKTVQAMMPLVPLPHRPRHDLSNYFLLWEANWHPAPPVDPYLLRPITGSLMEIIAEWDVTPVELAAVRSAMRTR